MPESRTSSRYLKPFTITAFVLLLTILIPLGVLEKARRDAQVQSGYAPLKFNGIDFDSTELVTLTFGPFIEAEPASSDFEPHPLISLDWSLRHWEITDIEFNIAYWLFPQELNNKNADLSEVYEQLPSETAPFTLDDSGHFDPMTSDDLESEPIEIVEQ